MDDSKNTVDSVSTDAESSSGNSQTSAVAAGAVGSAVPSPKPGWPSAPGAANDNVPRPNLRLVPNPSAGGAAAEGAVAEGAAGAGAAEGVGLGAALTALAAVVGALIILPFTSSSAGVPWDNANPITGRQYKDEEESTKS